MAGLNLLQEDEDLCHLHSDVELHTGTDYQCLGKGNLLLTSRRLIWMGPEVCLLLVPHPACPNGNRCLSPRGGRGRSKRFTPMAL